MMEIRPLESSDETAVDRFLDRVPEGDRTFFKEDVADPTVRAAWFRPGNARLLAVDGETVVGYVAVVPLASWSRHVGELRVIVDPEHRGRGIGQALTRRAMLEALELGLTKMVIEVRADHESRIDMFRALGFVPEALLADHVRDHAGNLHDLMVLGHSVEAWNASLEVAGIEDGLGAR
jgi:ribosomal protein S18 acetylase RimI-like enzyme